ncbi:VOC family protein [Alphaproteobacteria bacterium KMM 3653]|uniref:VOC family protein n=1 Tax=Harenicola maris TaxID=2841044 RepID=A0AAP2CNS8_9RHOB|nr:VOC family protein [Harenicola maris]
MARLEHINITVADAKDTAALLGRLFGWRVRWQGATMQGEGLSVHVGGDEDYIALFSFAGTAGARDQDDRRIGLNHIGVVVDDLDAVEARVLAEGLRPHHHADYEPGRRFYFMEGNGIEIEVVEYG